jgi:hypothetical protein
MKREMGRKEKRNKRERGRQERRKLRKIDGTKDEEIIHEIRKEVRRQSSKKTERNKG